MISTTEVNGFKMEIRGDGLTNRSYANWVVSNKTHKIIKPIRGHVYLAPGTYYAVNWSYWNKRDPPSTTTIKKFKVIIEQGELKAETLEHIEISHDKDEVPFANDVQKAWISAFQPLHPGYHGRPGGFGQELSVPFCDDLFNKIVYMQE